MSGFDAALARRLDPVSRAPLVVAYSGGGDSTALLHMILRHTKRTVLALTVDHGLHPDSARWTAEAGERARALGVKWRALTWTGDKPATGVQAKARAARHALLADAAREAGARVILMAQTADDAAEGALMRAGDAPGLGHLREWSPSPAWPEGRGVFLLRPMLEVRREDLRAYLRENGLGWFDDPANEDVRYARVRAREALKQDALLASPPGGGRGRERGWSAERGDLLRGPRSALRPETTPIPGPSPLQGEGGVGWSESGVVTQRPGLTPTTLPPLLLSISGRTTPPRSAEVARLLAVIEQGGVATLSGCRIDARADPVRITRTPPRRSETPRPTEPAAWMRYRFEAALGLYPNEAAIPLLSA